MFTNPITVTSDLIYVQATIYYYVMMYVLEGEFTLFAPTDAAFAVYKDNLLSPSAPNAQAIYQGMYCFFNITRLI